MRNKKLFIVSVILMVLITTLFSGCGENIGADNKGSSSLSDKVSPEWYSEKNDAVRPFGYGADYQKLNAEYQKTGQRDKELMYVYEYLPNTLESFVEGNAPQCYTSLVARGRIVGFDYHVIREYPRGDADNTEYIVTDYYVDLIETMRGEPETDDKGLIKVRVLGGETETSAMANLEYNFAVGNEYLFILKLPYAPSGTATDENGCYSINLIYSASEKVTVVEETDGSGTVNFKEEPMFFIPYILRDEVKTIALSDFREYIKTVNETYAVPSSDQLRDAAIKNMEAYLQNGGISQGDYDVFIERLDKYAEIIG